jgi:phage terminase small subunit
MSSPRPLTPKQERFALEYLIDLNSTAAYQRAGFQAKGNAAEVNDRRLLRDPRIRAAVEAGKRARAQRTEASADQVIGELTALAFSDLGQVLDFAGGTLRLRPADQIPEAARRAIASVKVRRYVEGKGDAAQEVELVEFKLWSKLEALAKLGQHLGLFKERHEHAGPHGGPIPVAIYIPDNGRNPTPTGAPGALPVEPR